VFGIVNDKAKLAASGSTESPALVAWVRLVERLERFSTKNQSAIVLVHDEDGDFVRKVARRTRRLGIVGAHYGSGSLKLR